MVSPATLPRAKIDAMWSKDIEDGSKMDSCKGNLELTGFLNLNCFIYEKGSNLKSSKEKDMAQSKLHNPK